MIEITREELNELQEEFFSGSGRIRGITPTVEEDSVYVTVERILGEITVFKLVDHTEESDKKLLDEFMETLAVFDTSKYTRTTEYIKQESKRLIQAVRDYDNK